MDQHDSISTDELITIQLALAMAITSFKDSGVDLSFTSYEKVKLLEKKITAKVDVRISASRAEKE